MLNLFKRKKVTEDVITEDVVTEDVDLNYIVEKFVITDNKDQDDYNDEENKVQITKIENSIIFLKKEMENKFENEAIVFQLGIKKLKEELKKLTIERKIHEANQDYPRINLDFLSMRKMYVGTTETLKNQLVPAFSFHKYISRYGKHEHFENCDIEVKIIRSKTKSYYCLGIWNDYSMSECLKKIYNEIFYKCLLDKSDHNRYDRVKISSKFIGIIPEKTKEKVKKACECGLEVYLIKECESWATTQITRDPLIIGLIDGTAYLIDKFDCTDLENYVSKEFTEGEL